MRSSGARAEAVLGEDDFHAGTFELFGDQVLIRKVARQTVRREQQDGFHFALSDGVAQTVERRTIERLAADSIILREVLRGDLITVLSGVVLKHVNL